MHLSRPDAMIVMAMSHWVEKAMMVPSTIADDVQAEMS